MKYINLKHNVFEIHDNTISFVDSFLYQ